MSVMQMLFVNCTGSKCLKKNCKGVVFVEYAILLSFILLAGTVFIDSGGVSDSINGVIDSTVKVFDGAAPNKMSSAEKMKLLSQDMKDAIDDAILKAGLYDSNGVPTIARGVNFDSNQKDNETVQALDKYIREYLKAQNIDVPVDSMYWSIGRSVNGEPNTIRFGWTTFDINNYASGSYIPMIQYSYNDSKKYREYQLCEKQVQNDHTINWSPKSKNVVNYGDKKDQAIDAFINKYMGSDK